MDLDSDTMEVYDYAWGNGASHAFNGYEMFSQEFRLDSSYDGALNFSAGFYYADIEQEFITGQNAALMRASSLATRSRATATTGIKITTPTPSHGRPSQPSIGTSQTR